MRESLYKDVTELPKGALDILRWDLAFDSVAIDSDWYSRLTDAQKAVVDNAGLPDYIPDEVLFAAYDGISFCPEDFTSMAGDDWSKV